MNLTLQLIAALIFWLTVSLTLGLMIGRWFKHQRRLDESMRAAKRIVAVDQNSSKVISPSP